MKQPGEEANIKTMAMVSIQMEVIGITSNPEGEISTMETPSDLLVLASRRMDNFTEEMAMKEMDPENIITGESSTETVTKNNIEVPRSYRCQTW